MLVFIFESVRTFALSAVLLWSLKLLQWFSQPSIDTTRALLILGMLAFLLAVGNVLSGGLTPLGIIGFLLCLPVVIMHLGTIKAVF